MPVCVCVGGTRARLRAFNQWRSTNAARVMLSEPNRTNRARTSGKLCTSVAASESRRCRTEDDGAFLFKLAVANPAGFEHCRNHLLRAEQCPLDMRDVISIATQQQSAHIGQSGNTTYSRSNIFWGLGGSPTRACASMRQTRVFLQALWMPSQD